MSSDPEAGLCPVNRHFVHRNVLDGRHGGALPESRQEVLYGGHRSLHFHHDAAVGKVGRLAGHLGTKGQLLNPGAEPNPLDPPSYKCADPL